MDKATTDLVHIFGWTRALISLGFIIGSRITESWGGLRLVFYAE